MLGSDARQGALRRPISVSCIGDGIRTLEHEGCLALLNRRCDARRPSGTSANMHVWSPVSSKQLGGQQTITFWKLDAAVIAGELPVWDPDSVGPALRAGSSCTTTGRQATLCDACSRQSILRRDVADVVFVRAGPGIVSTRDDGSHALEHPFWRNLDGFMDDR